MKLLFILLLLFQSFSTQAEVAKNVLVEQSFARAAIQQQRNSAAYMNVTNIGGKASIVYAKSPVAKIVELHTHINDRGIMRMRKINQIELPNQKMVQLKPGGLHIMMLGLNRDLKSGDFVAVTLGFDDGSEKLLQVPVQNTMKKMKKSMKAYKKDGSLPKLITH
ncbi:MAG: copper chaperone PCu(A)C [Gammaproteobacteria bacterium]|jgi:hypothetical protein|nr:copper chaperone PCu(A)C [Gammaproteobacteria bacterium]MBT3723691.1 copper chaperone PCu(A)C [Gammaproteobacteria bacterium]MBT4075051.1 copper chaperone PCu(A)C [Gammaproteobacteria bacterium]MBT4195227.1 copper chaperone PCu(A)C [Gammaproteobacteria bacterium]MBT4448289.1 copper chaperone PCu(A)C [Gammaproteobacteria bacterium]